MTEQEWLACADSQKMLRYYPGAAAAYNVAIPLGWWGAAPAFVAPYKVARETVPNTSDEGAAQGVLLRDIFGNPFRPVSPNSAWLTDTVLSLAQDIYDKQAFDRLPILADALEEAGCDDADILGHCRERGNHVRGCWPIDLLLGKQ